MPFTVSCAACNSRFLLGDDLFRRKVSGKVVTVKCRHCNAEISVDATEPVTLPSQEAPRRARPAPPRPKRKEGDATVTPLPADALLSIWDAAEKKGDATRKPPPPRRNSGDFIDDIEEPPPSSSDAPSLNSLTHEAAPKRPRSPKKAPDDFLVNLSTGTGGILGAPTIDVMGLASPPAPDVEELLEVEATELTPHAGTVPLFDMSAVLPVANGASKSVSSSLSPSHVDLAVDVELPPAPSSNGKTRERKYVVAPATRPDAAGPKNRRASAAVWFVLVAAAAGILLVVGMRERERAHRTNPEAQPAEHPTSLAETSTTSNAPPTLPTAASADSSASAVAASNATKPATSIVTTSPTAAIVAASSATAAKSTEGAKAVEAEHPKEEATPAVVAAEPEKPAVPAPKPEPAEPGTEFDRGAAIAALKSAAAEAASCRKDGDPSGTAILTITFAPSGRVTSANIQGPPFAGTPTGGCIANAMRHAHVPAFSGDRVTVNKTIAIE